MEYQIEYYSEAVAREILSLPDTLAARYVVLTRRMTVVGANLGLPHEGDQACSPMNKSLPS